MVYLYELVPPNWLPARATARLALTASKNRLENYIDRDHGVAFELPMTVLEKLTGYTDMGDILLLRHRCVFLVCCAGLGAFYWLATQRLRSWRAGLLGTLLLLLSPRLFAECFYNAKDSIFLACFLLATATAVSFVQRPNLTKAAWHALTCALAIDVRLMGVLLPVLTLALLALRTIHGDYRGQRLGRPVFLYIGLLPLLVVACWPYLWSAPVAHFVEAFAKMRHFRWYNIMLYRGQLISTSNPLPWHYAPVWISITTPLLYLAGLLLSAGLLVRQLARYRWRLYVGDGWQDLLFWGLGLLPLVSVVVLHSILYDGWRQLYFVYPPLLLLALRGLVMAWRWQPPWSVPYLSWQVVAGLGIALPLASTAIQMIRLHPLENLYFNALAGSHPELRYEYDYWGLSFRQGLQWILRHDSRPLIRVQTNLSSADISNRWMLTPAERARLVIQRKAGPADYLMTTYRYHPQPYQLGAPVYSLRVEAEGRRVFDIFRLR